MCLGTAVGKCDLYQKVSATALTMTPSNLPNDGSKIYARLYYKINGAWHYVPYTYIAP